MNRAADALEQAVEAEMRAPRWFGVFVSLLLLSTAFAIFETYWQMHLPSPDASEAFMFTGVPKP